MGACQSAVVEANKGGGADDVHIKLDHAAAPVGLRHAAREEPALGEFDPVVLMGGLALPHDDDVAARAAARAFAAEVAQEHGQPVRVEGAEHRATNLRELGLLVEHVKQHSRSWVGRRWSAGAWREVRGLKPEEVNLYDVNLNLLARLGAELGISFSELFARGQERKPKVFLSHAWSHSLLQTYEALVQHARDRGYGEDGPIWICAFAIRQHAVELGAIEVSPFFKALKASAMTLIIVAAEGEGVLDRSWCALEMNLAMVEGGAAYLADIYAHYKGSVQRLTDGFLEGDVEDEDEHLKAERDGEFPFAIIEHALNFALADTKAAKQRDHDNIVQYVQRQAAGVELLDATVRARYFVAALEAVVKAHNGAALVAAGFEALGRSALPRLSLRSKIDEVHAHTLVRSLPSSVVEVLLPGVEIGNEGAMLVGTFLSSSKAMNILDLNCNKIGDVGALGLGKALEVNASLTRLDLDRNQIGDAGAVGLGKALEVNGSLTELNLWNNQISDAGAVGLGKALEVNGSLKILSLNDTNFGDASKSAIRTAWLSKTGRQEASLFL